MNNTIAYAGMLSVALLGQVDHWTVKMDSLKVDRIYTRAATFESPVKEVRHSTRVDPFGINLDDRQCRYHLAVSNGILVVLKYPTDGEAMATNLSSQLQWYPYSMSGKPHEDSNFE